MPVAKCRLQLQNVVFYFRARNTIKIVSSEAPKPTVKPAMLIEVEELEGRDVMAATPPAPEHSNTKWLQRSIRTNDALDHPNFLRQERTFVEAFEPRPPTPQYRDTSPDSATYGDDHSVHILRPFTEPAFEFVPQVKTSTTLATTLNF
ncbi:uncharacterized protein LOC131952868 isoform X2 [Physella acuta]|uniref:uncharacterized protein LOC131952868 isoform X2 n=1 Tax=Physella acuta TaxID=109671 RepID=UPI0027DBA244|nr:uncharacterized protein LOC131952868 isoform X2 [Physella acuta]